MEYKRKCNSCGKIFCYTDDDMKNNVKNAGMGLLSAVGGMASIFGGTVFHTAHLQNQTDRYMDKVVDFDRCPYCHSRNISGFTGNAADIKKQEKPTRVININGSASTEALLKRAFIFLEDEDWESADAYCEACLDKDPELAEAYIVKMMAELHIKAKEQLKDQKEPFDKNSNYQKALRYADDDLKSILIGYIEHISNRNENDRKDKILSEAKSKMSGLEIANYEKAISLFVSIAGWKDANEQQEICRKKIAELRAKEEADRLERERLAEIARQKAEEEAARKVEKDRIRTKRNKKIAMIVAPIACVMIGVIIYVTTVLIPSNKYQDALVLMDAGEFLEAKEAFESLGDYKDSAKKARECKEKNTLELKNAKVGDCVKFGNYEQDNDMSNGMEELLWRVLQVADGKALLLSEYGIDSQKYHNDLEGIHWAESTLREWLNKEFLNAAFTEDEAELIITTTVSDDDNPEYFTSWGDATYDKIFLLSRLEAKKYIISDAKRVCKVTAYAKAEGASAGKGDIGYWWLRSPGNLQNMAIYVNNEGDVNIHGNEVDAKGFAIRPAMWIDLNSL